jgi:signal recognition particle subunit SEC65
VVAVVKIHFLPYTIKRGDRSTKIIKKLARTLGTELLSLHVRESLLDAQKELARQRLEACNNLAHELRNTLIKLGFIFTAVNAEISYLREQWESQILQALPHLESKESLLSQLTQIVRTHLYQINGGGEDLVQLGQRLMADQDELAAMSPLPQVGELWLKNKIRPKWRRLLTESHTWDVEKEEIYNILDRLEKAIWIGMDESLAEQVSHVPEEIRAKWSRLAYTDFSAEKISVLEEILQLLSHPNLVIPHKQQTKKVLISLKALVEILPEVEERANKIMFSLKNGSALGSC